MQSLHCQMNHQSTTGGNVLYGKNVTMPQQVDCVWCHSDKKSTKGDCGLEVNQSHLPAAQESINAKFRVFIPGKRQREDIFLSQDSQR